MRPKYPDVHVKLVGEDGNAFTVLSRVREALRRAGLPREEVKAYLAEAISGDYNNLLATTIRWVEVE